MCIRARGNVAVVGPFLFYAIMACVVLWSCAADCRRDEGEQSTYSSTQKHRATNSFATALLLSRDGLLEKMETGSGKGGGKFKVKGGGEGGPEPEYELVAKLQHELGHLAQAIQGASDETMDFSDPEVGLAPINHPKIPTP